MERKRFLKNPENAERLGILLILALAAFLRLAALGRDGLWADECFGAVRASLPLRQLAPQLAAERQAPLYHLLQKPFASAAGPAERRLRLPSALLGILAVFMLWLAARAIVSARAGLVAAFLLAVSPLHVHYSREARNYVLLTLAVVAALWAMARLARRPTAGAGLLAGLSLLAILYTHDIGAVYAAAVLAAGLVLVRRAPQRRTALGALAIAFAVAAIGYLPWLSAALSRSAAIASEYDWLLPMWRHEFPWQVGRSLAALSHGSMPPIRNHVRDLYWTVWPALGLSALLIGLGLRRRREWRMPAGAAALPLAALLPLVALFVFSVLASPVYAVGRVDSAALPFLLILIAAGAAALPSRALLAGVLAAFAGLALLPLQVDITLDTRSQERSIARHLAAAMDDGDVLVMACTYRSSQEYYLRFWKPRASIRSFPAIRELHPFWIDWGSYPGDALGREARAVAAEALAAARERGGRSVWVMAEPDARNQAVLPELARLTRPGPTLSLGYGGLRLARFLLPD